MQEHCTETIRAIWGLVLTDSIRFFCFANIDEERLVVYLVFLYYFVEY